MPIKKKMYVVYCEDHGTYWCGLNTWDDQLRKANIFHSLKYANEVHERFKQLKLKNVEIRMELVPENPTNADRIRAMSDEELAKFLECFGCCHNCTEHHRLGDVRFFQDEKCDEQCEQHCLEWLKQPAEEGADHG